MLMHATLLLAGAGAIVAGVVTFSPSNHTATPVAASRFETTDAAQQPPKSLAETNVTVPADISLRDAVISIAGQAKVGLVVDWSAMQDHGITTDEAMGVSVTEIPAGEALTLLAESASSREAPLDWRARNNRVEFGLRRDLDARDIELVTYDITATINLIAADFAESKEQASEQVISLITSLVEPENWRDNGGDLAQVMLVGGRLFVEAPSRMHGKIKWILDQLPNMPGEKPQVKADAAGTPLVQDVPLLGQTLARRSDAPPAMRRILNPGDSLTVNVYELYQPQTWSTATRRIDELGMLRVSEVGDVRAAGLTVDQLRAEIVQQLKSKGVLNEERVEVDLGGGGSS
jgi:hypothetical protein